MVSEDTFLKKNQREDVSLQLESCICSYNFYNLLSNTDYPLSLYSIRYISNRNYASWALKKEH